MQTGTASIRFERPPRILQAASVVGPKEAEGPLGPLFDEVDPDGSCGQDNWEQAESELQKRAAKKVLEKAHLSPKQIRYVLAGDLLGQCIASNFGISELNCPTIGMYGACSTMGLTLATGAMLVNADYADHVLCVTSSHYSSAERQFRFPSDYGNQRPLSAEWTVTGAGAVVLESVQAHTTTQLDIPLAKITGITTGKIVDYGITDSMNMGAAMAPAACDTIAQHFEDFKTKPSDYDKIITGDLSQIGSKLLIDLLREKQIDISDRHMDCGLEIFERKEQDVHAGGSGCGCSAVTLAAYILPQIQKKIWKRVLFVPTGALLSKISFNEGASIPGIAHAVVIEEIDSFDKHFEVSEKKKKNEEEKTKEENKKNVSLPEGGIVCKTI